MKVGRLDDSGLLLQDNTVSRKHSILRIGKNDKCTIEDDESKYGTLVYDGDL